MKLISWILIPFGALLLAIAIVVSIVVLAWIVNWFEKVANGTAAERKAFEAKRAQDDAEALQIANGTEYGLGGGLWTNNLQRAHKFAREMKNGMVWINCYKRVNPGSPFGGVGVSGYGREMGFDAMREYTQVKSIWVNVDAQIAPYYQR